MSISEKLITIAENMQRIFDAGYQKGINASGGGGDENTITFYVNGSPFTAEAGMTWADFMNSESAPKTRFEDCCNQEIDLFFGTMDYDYAVGEVGYKSSCCGPYDWVFESETVANENLVKPTDAIVNGGIYSVGSIDFT